MLAQTPADVRFINFCRMKGEETFNYMDRANCALAQFGQYEHPEAKVYGNSKDYDIVGENGRIIETVDVLHRLEQSQALTRCKTFADVVRIVGEFVEA